MHRKIPSLPGIYFMKDRHGDTIYIGKAKNLKKRVASYFTKTSHDPKTALMVSQIADVDYMVTDTEVEALILESNLIKKNKPKYNIDLKDSKRYAYIRLTEDNLPRIVIAREMNLSGQYFGPFVSGEKRDRVIKITRNIFKLCTKRKPGKRACLRYHIGLCKGACAGYISREEYLESIKDAKEFLAGHNDHLINSLKKRMEESSKDLEFEKAKTLRDQIDALTYLDEKQKMERTKLFDQDVIGYVIDGVDVYIAIFNIHKGTLINRKEFQLERRDGFFEEFISRFYDSQPIPKELIIPEQVSSAMVGYLSHISGLNVKITIPQRGVKKKLLELAVKNIEIKHLDNKARVDDLKKQLALRNRPTVIECFDISHLSGTSHVGSMVQFREGVPDKKNYRRFKIRTVDGIDDFAAMAEVVRRRYRRLKMERKKMPDLIVIDGGKGQLGMAVRELRELELKIEILALAKRHEEVFAPGRDDPFIINGKAKHLLQRARDEAHRFAITYNRLLRSKKLVKEDS